MKNRKPVCAGSWYNDNPEELTYELDRYLSNVKFENLNIKALIVPHAGYMFSGQTAAFSFKQLNSKTKKVIILGTAHRYPLRGASIIDYDYYESPLGKVKLSDDIKNILRENSIVSIPEADYEEHSIEIEIPFLQRTLGDFSIIPIIVGKVNEDDFSEVLEKYFDDDTVIVASVDLSHFHNYEQAKALDKYSIDCVLSLNDKGIKKAEIDSPYAIASLILLAKRKGWKAKLLDYKNSGDIIKDKISVVGYSAIAFYEENNKYFSNEDRVYMENLAKESVEEYIKNGKRIRAENISGNLKKDFACFVTIKVGEELRGCIGTIEPVDKLYRSIIDNAISAATRDHRFLPVREEELSHLNYEISILSKPLEIFYSKEKELFEKIRNKGLIISKYSSKAVYLPQVWESFRKEEEFLSSLCRKAGLGSREWKEKGMKFFVFETL